MCSTSPTSSQVPQKVISATAKLLTSPTSACSSGTGYRTETFVQPFVVTGLDTTNRIQVALGITDLFFDFTSSNFTWDVSVASYNTTSMNVLLYVNGSNTIMYLGISYLVSSNLYFDIGYSQTTFKGNEENYAATDDVTNTNNASNTFVCAGDYSVNPLNPVPKTCRFTKVTVPYNPSVIKNTSANVGVRTFLTGITAYRPGTDNIGFKISGESTNSTYFTYNATASCTALLIEKPLKFT